MPELRVVEKQECHWGWSLGRGGVCREFGSEQGQLRLSPVGLGSHLGWCVRRAGGQYGCEEGAWLQRLQSWLWDSLSFGGQKASEAGVYSQMEYFSSLVFFPENNVQFL